MLTLAPLSARNYFIGSAIVALVVLVFLGSTLRSGHNWDGDYALNIMQARNLVEGTPYGTTAFIPNATNAIHPALYPPGLPLLLTAAYGEDGLDLDRMKWVGVTTLVAWLLLLAWIARDLLSPRMALAATALMGVHPYLWELKDSIYAEFPFLLFSYATLFLAGRLADFDRDRSSKRLAFAAGLAVMLAAAYLTRTIGIVLLPVIFVFGVYATRRLVTATNGALAAALALIVLVQHWLPSDAGTYAGYFSEFSLYGVRRAFIDYGTATGTLLQVHGLLPHAVGVGVVLVFLALVATGFVARLLERPTIFELFLVAYVTLLMLFPIHWEFDRYSMPIWPLLLIYGLRGAQVVGARLANARGQQLLPALMIVGLIGSFGVVYANTDFTPLEISVTREPAQQLFAAIRNDIPDDAVILARKPTIIGLFTRHRAAIWPNAFTDAQFWEFAKRIDASYLVQDVFQFSAGPFDPDDPLDVFVRTNQAHLRLVFRNEWFNVYALQPP